MPVPRRLLTEGEDVIAELHPHWSYLGRPLPVAVAAVAGLIALTVGWPSAPAWFGGVVLVVVALALLWLWVRIVRWRTTSLVVTNLRLLQRSGILSRRGLDVRLARINEISYHQSIRGRLVGSGQLYVEIGGDRGTVAFDHVRKPAAVAGLLHEQIDALSAPPRADDRRDMVPEPSGRWHDRGPDDTPPAGTAGLGLGRRRRDDSSVADRLVELDELRRRGILTDEEFTRKKAELLDRM